MLGCNTYIDQSSNWPQPSPRKMVLMSYPKQCYLSICLTVQVQEIIQIYCTNEKNYLKLLLPGPSGIKIISLIGSLIILQNCSILSLAVIDRSHQIIKYLLKALLHGQIFERYFIRYRRKTTISCISYRVT